MQESELYPLVRDWLYSSFSQRLEVEWGSAHRRVVDTSQVAWAQGQWMRPDLIMTSVRRRIFDPFPLLEVYGFEVKADPANLPAVHQALAHGRVVDFPTLVAPSASTCSEGVDAVVREQAQRHGVGLVVFDNPRNWDSYRVLVEPTKGRPDADWRDQFLVSALSSEDQKELKGWMAAGG